MSILIKNGYLLDPATKTEGVSDLLIEDGFIKEISPNINTEAEQVIDAKGHYVMPGFIDLHVHLREPGFEYKETIATGSRAAARGGYTTICPMPNTRPVIDSKQMVEVLVKKAEEDAVVHVLPIGAVTKDQVGAEISDIKGMVTAGAAAISEDGKSVMNTALYQRAMIEAKKAGIPVFAHCEDKDLVGKGVLNESKKSQELGMPGISNAVEDVIAARDILLAKNTGVKLHLCHCSTRDSVTFIDMAKKSGLPVTGEVCPHHFAMADEEITGDDANYKMNPPLRSREDIQALKDGLKSNIMDVIATDHAPHSAEEKAKSIQEAPFGIVGLETAFALTMTELVEQGYLTPMQMVEKMSLNPAKVLGIDKGILAVGKAADIVIADPKEKYRIDVNEFASKGKNTPFHGKEVVGRIKVTIVDGNIVFKDK
ncbi:dihydroorotase [Anaerocolumna sp. MB42-C2]|uniref:dihydroorotase n=1 Tax=Anaerocolumna sp. MB42-C2 TaxID=3070997 RepID=UPI0027DF7DAD|nr:dihydroorotase [Anaerocolumna sp. MB42-C2]WMJ87517.1 dihydroorotase [Anaerocolumna sp. MB42-C2]